MYKLAKALRQVQAMPAEERHEMAMEYACFLDTKSASDMLYHKDKDLFLAKLVLGGVLCNYEKILNLVSTEDLGKYIKEREKKS